MTLEVTQHNSAYFNRANVGNHDLLNDPVPSVVNLGLALKYLAEGKAYSIHDAIGPMAANEHYNTIIEVPSEVNCALSAAVTMALAGTVRLYYGATFTGGTVFDPVEHNQIMNIEPKCTITHQVTVTDPGTLIGEWVLSSQAKEGKSTTSLPLEGVFAFGNARSPFYIDFESGTADNYLQYDIQWGEPISGSLSTGEIFTL